MVSPSHDDDEPVLASFEYVLEIRAGHAVASLARISWDESPVTNVVSHVKCPPTGSLRPDAGRPGPGLGAQSMSVPSAVIRWTLIGVTTGGPLAGAQVEDGSRCLRCCGDTASTDASWSLRWARQAPLVTGRPSRVARYHPRSLLPSHPSPLKIR